MRRYLVVANQTLGGEPLLRAIRASRASGPSSFHVLVPATPVHEHGTWTEGKARAVASERLEQTLAALPVLLFLPGSPTGKLSAV
jgi:GABA permease